MPARNHAEPWVLALRNTLRASVGAAYRIGEKRGKTRLDVRFDDGSRETATLEIAWLPASSRSIQDQIERIAGLIAGGHSLKSARESLYGAMPVAPTAVRAEEHQVQGAWEAFGAWKVERNQIQLGTWQKDYAKTGVVLGQCLAAVDAHDLLERAARHWEPGSRQRKQGVQHLAAMLRWATGKDGRNRLASDRWTPPPPGGALKNFYGEPSAERRAKTKEDTVPLLDDEILGLLKSLPLGQANHPRDREAAKRWLFAFQLMACYGLRPVEIHFLEVRSKNGKPFMWCSYSKKSGGGTGKPRWLYPWHPEWQSDWNLLERVANSEPLPTCTAGAGEAALVYLKRNEFFKPLHAKGCTSKSFRHGYAHRCHQQYHLAPATAAAYMGHTLQVHLSSYAQWCGQDVLDDQAELAIQRKRLLEAQG